MVFDKNNLADVKKHRSHFICIATTIFVLVGIGHLLRVSYGWSLVVGGVVIPLYVSWLAVFITLLMVVMGVAYLKK